MIQSHKIAPSTYFSPIPYQLPFPQHLDVNQSLTTKYYVYYRSLVLGDKIFHCVVWKKFLHLPVKLRRQRLIVCNDQRRFVQLLNNICHGKCLTGTCDSKQRLELIALLEAFDQFFDCLGLVSCGLVFGMKFEDLL